MRPVFENPKDGNPIGAVCPEGSPCRGSKLFVCFDTDSQESAIAAWNTRSDTREQAAASPSAVGEGLLIELLRRAYRFVQSDNEFTERDWTEYENTKDEIRAVLSGQSPLRDALQTMIASAEVYVERDEVIGYRIKTGALHRVIGMLGLTVPCNLPVATLHANYGGFTQKSLDDARDYPLSSQAPKPASAGGERCSQTDDGECFYRKTRRLIGLPSQSVSVACTNDVGQNAIAAEADTAKEDAADVARYSADDFVAPPPSEWSPAGQRRLIEALEQHKPATTDRLAPIEARGTVTDAEVERALDIWCNKPVTDDTNLPKSLRDRSRAVLEAFLRARESAPAVEK
jgi:hypothetical protein